MKAKDYFEKYGQKIADEFVASETNTLSKETHAFLVEMCDETVKILEARHAKSNGAVVGVIREMNDKWNAICVLFEKKYGVSPLKRNGFREFWIFKMPELGPLLDPQRAKLELSSVYGRCGDGQA